MPRRITATVGVRHYQVGATDRRNNPIKGYTPPVPTPVYAIAPATRTEPGTEDRPTAVSSTWEVYAPAGTTVGPHDLVILPTGEECEVIGEVGIWDGNPNLPTTNNRGVHFVLQRHQG